MQQTRVDQGLAYYERFLEAYPSLATLAAAPLDEILRLWEGLGYYSRARNLHRAAKELMQNGGEFPKTAAELEQLPGIGPYTARAISSIAFGEPVAVVDGNVLRVLSRLLAEDVAINASTAKRHYQQLADGLLQDAPPGDFNQAMMELGARVCTPRKPRCSDCPVETDCLALSQNLVATLPIKHKKGAKGERHFRVFYLYNAKGQFAVQQRDGASYWKHLWELPTEEVAPAAALTAKAEALTSLKHEFSHFSMNLYLTKRPASQAELNEPSYRWVSFADVKQLAFGRPMRKLLDYLEAAEVATDEGLFG